jgi:hypothetical protein
MEDESKSKVARAIMKVLTWLARLSYCHPQLTGYAWRERALQPSA